jgi:type IV pilus assembly protein PilW
MIMLKRKFRRQVLSRIARRQRGLSLIELMIAITLGLMILAAMVLVFANTSAARNEVDRTARQIENGRYAIELLREDIQLAGYFGEINIQLIAVPAAIPDPCSTVLAEWTGAMKLHVQGVNNFTAGNLSCLTAALAAAALPTVKANTDVIIIRRVKTCVAGAAGCDTIDANKPYLQVPLCNTETATHELSLFPGTFAHTIKDCATPAVLRPYVVYFYYVGTDNTLNRATFDPNPAALFPITEFTPLVDGIENLQIEYGVDADNNGSADSYQAASAMTVGDWANVMTVQINLLAQNTEISPRYTDTKTYNLGTSGGDVGPFLDGRRRNVYSALVRIQNPSGLRDTP